MIQNLAWAFLDLRHWVNDGLMVVFFFGVGLEIKREFLVGDLAILLTTRPLEPDST